MRDWTNWAGNQTGRATRDARPATVEGVIDAVQAAARDGLKVKAVGSGHSFTGLALTSGVRLDLRELSGLRSIDRAARLITVQAGMPLHRLNAVLAEHGLALPNLGDIDAQTVAGAIATGTHGSGATLGSLSSFVESLELVTANGEILRCSATQNPEIFAAARVNLGALGVVTELTLRCVDAFILRADERVVSLPRLLDELPELVAANDHVDVHWFPYTDRANLKCDNRVATSDQPLTRWRRWLDDELLANTVYAGLCRLGRAAPRLVPGIAGFSAGGLRPRSYTGASYQVFCSPRRVRFLEMEYSVPRECFREAFGALQAIIDDLPSNIMIPVELRFCAADDSWLSHGYGRDSAYIAIHQYIGMPYRAYFERFEQVATALGGRPHWGKVHWRDAESLAPAYPRFSEFRAVRDKLDPDRRFANDYLDRVLG